MADLCEVWITLLPQLRPATAPLAPSTGVLRRALDTLAPLLGPAPRRPLSSDRRRALAGRLFPEAPELVRAAARGLAEASDLFSGLRISGAALAARQERAERWRDLRDCLQQLAAQANDSYLEEQGQSIDEALVLLRHVEAAVASPLEANAIHESRRAALGDAFSIFSRIRMRGCRAALKRRAPPADAVIVNQQKDAP